MKTNDELVLTKEQLARNPQSIKIVKDAMKMRLELERLRVWENSEPRVVTPCDGQVVVTDLIG